MRSPPRLKTSALLSLACCGSVAAALASPFAPSASLIVAGCSLVVVAFVAGAVTTRKATPQTAAAIETETQDSPLAPEETVGDMADMHVSGDNIVLLEMERQSRADLTETASSPLDFAVAQLGEYPAYVDLLKLQLQSVTTVSEEAAEKLLANLLEVDRRVTTLMGFLQSAGSNDSSERILGRIEDQLSGCRQHLVDLSGHQQKSAQDSMTFQLRLADETKNVLGVLNGVQQIARQTTMLSLNVSIEAARVGDLGKGFAVIAQEIRSLAGEVQKLADDVHARVSNLMLSVGIDLQEQSKRRQDTEALVMSNVTDALGLLTTNLVLLLQHQREVLGRVKAENEDIAEPILSMMGSIQFQDIVRQQIEQITSMAGEVDTHLGLVRQGLARPSMLTDIEMLTEKLDKLSSSYVMREQREIHSAVLGKGGGGATAAVASIELF